MKTIEVHRSCAAFDSFRANLVRSLFNAPENADFHLTAELPADETDWQIGVIYGPSGTGKSSLGKQFWDGIGITDPEAGWHSDRPVIDEIARENPDLIVGKVNVDEEGALSRKFRVMSIPTLIVFDKGEVVNKNVGFINKLQVEALLR